VFDFRGVIEPAEIVMIARKFQIDFSDFRNDFFGEYDAKCETASEGRESGPQVGLI
jgi:hypothetical protein